MKYRDLGSGGDLFAIVEHQNQLKGSNRGILRLNELIDWEGFRGELESILEYDLRDHRKGGRPPFDPVFMFKVLVLQKFHGLSDEGTEEQIRDRFSFLEFLNLRPGSAIPDANTIWDFRESLEREGRNGSNRLFAKFEEHLTGQGLIGREGSIVDASFVEAPRQRNSRQENARIREGQRPEGFESGSEGSPKGRQKDCDARWTQKRNQNYYGYKHHAKVDARSKFILSQLTTTASVHDSQVLRDLVDQSDNALYGDSAYGSEEIEEYLLRDCDCEEFITLKARRNHPLSEEDRKINRLRNRVRARVEHVFGRLKHMGADFVRTIGITRARQHNALCSLVYNMDRYALKPTK